MTVDAKRMAMWSAVTLNRSRHWRLSLGALQLIAQEAAQLRSDPSCPHCAGGERQAAANGCTHCDATGRRQPAKRYRTQVNAVLSSLRDLSGTEFVQHFQPEREEETMTEKATPNIPITPVESSSNVAGVGYDAGTQTLAVQYKGGKTYHYAGVSPEIYAQLQAAKSVGSFVAATIVRGGYVATKVGG